MPIMHMRPHHLGQDDGSQMPPAQLPTPSTPSWFEQQFIQGIPNWVILGGFVLWTIARRPSHGGSKSRL